MSDRRARVAAILDRTEERGLVLVETEHRGRFIDLILTGIDIGLSSKDSTMVAMAVMPWVEEGCMHTFGKIGVGECQHCPEDTDDTARLVGLVAKTAQVLLGVAFARFELNGVVQLRPLERFRIFPGQMN